jgi:hypothetical protein
MVSVILRVSVANLPAAQLLDIDFGLRRLGFSFAFHNCFHDERMMLVDVHVGGLATAAFTYLTILNDAWMGK